MEDKLKRIRESEKKSHIEMYSNEQLYKSESWLKKPVKTVRDMIPLFREYKKLRVLDLGCGVGRNCIAVASEYRTIDCEIECVDILELAIEKLYSNAAEYGVASNVRGFVTPIEDYEIRKNQYDFIMAVSALEHVDTEASFVSKLRDVRDGICKNGIVCLIINSEVKEYEKTTGKSLPVQFEVNLHTTELQELLDEIFAGWTVLKWNVQEQQYDIPRETGMVDLKSNVVTFAARKVECKH